MLKDVSEKCRIAGVSHYKNLYRLYGGIIFIIFSPKYIWKHGMVLLKATSDSCQKLLLLLSM
ncbi:hypothetical protein CFP56_023985 [Quercus suber]|uniref:Uncharacterized protein n=1 Tax=Quercus suber TaxID=58331 RepID=A0AAW0K745_QUESU